ncbi:hypothetical protein CORC01_00368 [Colletotrichum orchidophilum]|uniref:FAD-binding PCMH-type domain-containing protein n=1 Tax=Colletotrichum orchidophilum TaxID=1209926 RepID=A0A1G4BT71_9PEZI|nr:uncharacterized protein CORC01_00368 [Colletotrichum orchidophilum]OHF04516.1 hypothetical protein CORC01_00368 [Colletotrichum orchidophilum]
MTSTSKAWDHSVDERIGHIAKGLLESPDFSNKEVPGLKDLLDDYINDDVDVDYVQFLRRLLKVFKDSETDRAYSHILLKHTDDGKRGSRDSSRAMIPNCVIQVGAQGIKKLKEPIHALAAKERALLHNTLAKMEDFVEGNKDELRGAGIVVYYKTEFQNWGLTVKNIPALTCVPKTSQEVQVIVKYAKTHNMGVRCSGFRHSWSPVFAENGYVLISLLGLHEVTKLPNITALPFPESAANDLQTINMVSEKPNENGNYLVRVGTACTNERLRRWCIENKTVTLPMNVIMVEITLGGSNAPICHGAGRRHQTLSDLVRRIEYVDCNGEPQEVTKPEHLRAASGCFGLMGVVTHITLEMSPMTYARLNPEKVSVALAVPPPADLDLSKVPATLADPWRKLTEGEKRGYQEIFEDRATNDFYSEWFWFPYSDKVWVNCWNNTTDSAGVVNFPDDFHIFLSFLQTFTMNVLQNTTLLNKLVDHCFTEAAVTLISRFAMWALPEKEVTTYLPDALHFQRAIQNVRVRDMEVEIPLVAKDGKKFKPGEPVKIDYAPIQRAWWDAILTAYTEENRAKCPMRMPLEMRIMGGSNVVMAPQRGNELGTCSIEVLTLQAASDIWVPFAQQVLDKWMALKDPNTQQLLKTRPHWAKEWEGLTVNGRPWLEKMKNEDYKSEIQEFLGIMADIGEEAGWTLDDLKTRFSNNLFDHLLFSNLPRKKASVTNVLQSRSVNKLPQVRATTKKHNLESAEKLVSL